MPLEATFDAIYPSVVALASLAVRRDTTGESARIPEILGTGFVLDARGVVVTAAHVARALQGLPRHPTHDRPAAVAIDFERPRAFAGFPFGSTALHLQFDEGSRPILAQITPFVRHGIVSSVHPFPCDLPHGFIIDAPSHGGASGSPIFHVDDPRVIGMLYAAFEGGGWQVKLVSCPAGAGCPPLTT